MPNFRETRACFAYAYGSNFINEQKFVSTFVRLSQVNKSRVPYCNYDRFDQTRNQTADECKAEFRCYMEDIYKLAEQLQLPDEITTYNGLLFIHSPLQKRESTGRVSYIDQIENLNISTDRLMNEKLPKFKSFQRKIVQTGALQKLQNSIQTLIILSSVYLIHTNSQKFWVIFEELPFCHFPPPNTSICG